MNILAIALLLLGALAVLVSAPFALFMPYRAMDDTERPVLRYLSVAVFAVVPFLMGACVFMGWQAFQTSNYVLSVQYAAFPALCLVIGCLVIVIATRLAKKKECASANAERAAH